MRIDSSSDILSLLIAILVGTGISLIYDIFKSFRVAFNNKRILIFFEDLTFSLIAALITYILLFVRVNGEIRWFILISEAAGFAISRYYISRFTVKFIIKFLKIIKKIIILPIKNFFILISNATNDKFDKIFKKILKKSLKDRA